VDEGVDQVGCALGRQHDDGHRTGHPARAARAGRVPVRLGGAGFSGSSSAGFDPAFAHILIESTALTGARQPTRPVPARPSAAAPPPGAAAAMRLASVCAGGWHASGHGSQPYSVCPVTSLALSP
jgi:hypothetical protein